MDAFEKLGVFYLGRLHDLNSRKTGAEPLLYDARDLVTHAVCVGMTGSGKTGLCLGLLEEAALDGIPSIAIDPKGDLGNLLLTFPDLLPADFRPWINEAEAAQQGLDPDTHAAAQATLWREGLAQWGQDGERIRRLRAAAEFTIYTPGSSAGTPISILKSLAAPSPALREDAELLGDRVGTVATSLLGLLGVDADPIQSREHILIATILQHAWRAGRDVELAGLIQAIQAPPVSRIGVLDVETFFPEKERFALALKLNNLLAAPGFETWLTGVPLDVDRLLFTPEGKPRVAIVSIAHLGDAERMFFVALLLNEIVGWMRSQPGTSSLRALVYMDEIFGFFPPVADPPSKRPLLTLVKQARAVGLGIVLATQNPVDLDYKGLSNAGTWFIGRLQTERDKARVLDGLEGVAAGSALAFERGAMDETLAGLGKRIFLMNNVHEKAPVVFESRWAMSYLRGPLTRAEIRRLSGDGPAAAPAAGSAPGTARPAGPIAAGRPPLPPGITETFVAAGVAPTGSGLLYVPHLLAAGEGFCESARAGVAEVRRVAVAAPFPTGAAPVAWDTAIPLAAESPARVENPADGARFEDLPGGAGDPRRYDAWRKQFVEWVYRTQSITVWRSPVAKAWSRTGESEGAFRVRLQQLGRERRDLAMDLVRKRFATRRAGLEEKLRKARQGVEREQGQARQQKVQTAISVGATILGAVLGRRAAGPATTAARSAGRSMKESGDIARAQETEVALEQQLAALEAEIGAALAALEAPSAAQTEPLEEVAVRPKKKDVVVTQLGLVWLPHWENAAGQRSPAWT
ncbi:MAG: ATP-binding protein [Gemmatimonadota bacterium]